MFCVSILEIAVYLFWNLANASFVIIQDIAVETTHIVVFLISLAVAKFSVNFDSILSVGSAAAIEMIDV